MIFDWPDEPKLNEAIKTVISRQDSTYALLNDFFPASEWLDTHVANKWQAHIFCPDGPTRLKVAKTAREVLADQEDIELKLNDNAWLFADLKPTDVLQA